jgi:arsenite oxidase small subunit
MKTQKALPPGATTAAGEVTDTSPRSEGSDGPDLKRREFCNRLLLTSSGLLVGASVLSAKGASQPGMQVAYPPQRIEGAESLMPGSALYFNYPTRNEPAILVRSAAGEYYAYSCRCSHMGCSVYFERAGRRLECPCHKGSYELQTGFVMNGPPTRALSQILLHMRAGGGVWAIGRTISRDNPNT